MTPAEDDQIISRYSELARAALRGDEVSDGGPAGSRPTEWPTTWMPVLTCSRSLANADQAQVSNVRFLPSPIESIQLPDNHADVVISNCVINLSGDKPGVLAKAYRVLKPGGRLGISDVTADAHIDPEQLSTAEQRVGWSASPEEDHGESAAARPARA